MVARECTKVQTLLVWLGRINWYIDKLHHHRVKLDHHGICLHITSIPFWREGEFAGVASF